MKIRSTSVIDLEARTIIFFKDGDKMLERVYSGVIELQTGEIINLLHFLGNEDPSMGEYVVINRSISLGLEKGGDSLYRYYTCTKRNS